MPGLCSIRGLCCLGVALACFTATSVAVSTTPGGSTFELPILSWNVHWQQGSDFIKGGRAAALTKLAQLVQQSGSSITAAIELETTSTEPVARNWPGWEQVNGSCPPLPGKKTGDTLLLAFNSSQFRLLAHGGGCLGGDSGRGYTADSRAFAVARVEPPEPVVGCPDGLCLLALHSPHINITNGTSTFTKVCGDEPTRCLVAMGDFNAPVKHRLPPYPPITIVDRLNQLMGAVGAPLSVAAPDVNTCCYPEKKYLGIDDHIATNIANAALLQSQVFPYQLKLSNDTEEHMPIAVTMALPV